MPKEDEISTTEQAKMSVPPRKLPHIQMIDGVPRSPFLKPEVCRQATNFKPAANDVILMTYPRSGTHWVTQIVLLLLSRGHSPKDLADLVRQAPFIEGQGAPMSPCRAPRFLRTHFSFDELKTEKTAKYIYVARNPWDTCVSFYHHVKEEPSFRFQDGTFEDFVSAFLNGVIGYGDQLDHILSGCARRHEQNVLFLTYEQLKADTAGAVLELARFLGSPYAEMLDEEAGLMDEILFKSSSDYMKGKFEASPDEIRVIFNNRPLPVDRDTKNTGHNIKTRRLVRKGDVDDWRLHFTPKLLKRMQVWIDHKTLGSDIMGLWESQSRATRLASFEQKCF